MTLPFDDGSFYVNLNFCKTPYCRSSYCSTDLRYSSMHTEIYAVAYNLTNFRVLWEILSDGTSGGNNIAATNVAATSSANNLKTDSIEKYCLFSAKTTDIIIDCEQSIYWDTLGILGHNLSAGVSIVVYGSVDGVNFPVNQSFTAQPSGETNTIFCLSTSWGSYRYWKIAISDTANTSNIYVGRIVMGQALVFDGENFSSQLKFRTQNYVEEENMNGYESAYRQRALRKTLRLNFENLSVTGGNYTEMLRYIRYVRTTLRALVIPDPAYPYRYSVWSKLAEMPEEDHNSVSSETSYTSFTLFWDEGK